MVLESNSVAAAFDCGAGGGFSCYWKKAKKE